MADDETNDSRTMLVYGASVIAALTIVFTIGVYVVAGVAEPHVDAMSYQVGERVAELARAHGEVGDVDEAVSLYELSLTKEFDDPRQRIWAMEEFGEYLLGLDRFAEAEKIAARAINEAPRDLKSYRILSQSLELQEKFVEAYAIEEKRLAEADRQSNAAVADLARKQLESLRTKMEE